MKIEFLLLPEYGEQSEQKWNKSRCPTRCGMAALQRGFSYRSHREGKVLFILEGPTIYAGAVPSGAAQEARCPAGTERDIQIVTKSSFSLVFPPGIGSSLAGLSLGTVTRVAGVPP